MSLIVLSAVASLLIVMPLTGATPGPGGQSAIPPVVWELVELPDETGQSQQLAEPERYTIQFLPDGKIGIRADCNRVTGCHAIADGALELELGASTLALCPPDSQADQFTQALASVTTFAFSDAGNLLLRTPAGEIALRPTLGGVRWEWQELQGSNDTVVTPQNPARYTIEFLPEGRLAIQADCNRATGTYQLEDPALELRTRGVTRAFCGEASLMHDYLRDLEAVSSFVFRDGRLYLALKMDAGIMRFEARAIEPGATPVAGVDD